MLREKPVERSERDVPYARRLTRRTQQREQRGQQRDAGNEGDDHPGAGDHAQLRHAAVLGRQERVEPGCSRRGGERQRSADFPAGIPQRETQVLARVALGAIAHAKLDAEVDAETDKEHGEGDRDQVERAEHDKAECRSNDQADGKAQQDRRDQAHRTQRDP